MKKIIYADNAATTPLSPIAFEAMRPFLLSYFGNPSQPYSLSRPCKLALKKAREDIAEYIHADPNEIYFTSGGTESDNWAIKGSVLLNGNRGTIITSSIEHHAVLCSCRAMESHGHSVTYLPVSQDGTVNLQNLQSALTSKTGLVSIMLANNEIGTIEPIELLAKAAHDNGALFHTDAVQAIGHIPVDVKVLDVDFLSASAHKFGGPKGIGFLYIKKGTGIGSFMDGGAQEKGIRAGTENVASIVGMAAALKERCSHIEQSMLLYDKENELLNELQKNGLTVGEDFLWNGNHDILRHLPGIISLSFRGRDGEMILHRLDLKGIIISTGAACDSHRIQVSHVIDAIGVPKEYAKGTIRISLAQNIADDELKAIAKALVAIVTE